MDRRTVLMELYARWIRGKNETEGLGFGGGAMFTTVK